MQPPQATRKAAMGATHMLALVAATALASCASPSAPPPTAGDCTTIRLWSNGWHANLALRADLFEEDHTLRRLFPDAAYFLVGWGERGFYMAENAGLWKGVKAVIPPSPSVVQVIAGSAPVEETVWRPSDLQEVAVSRTGAVKMTASIDELLAYDANGEAVILGGGRVEDASHFLAAEANFHLFNMCNHWTARRLREAGVPVSPHVSFTAPGLMAAVRRKTDATCPPGN